MPDKKSFKKNKNCNTVGDRIAYIRNQTKLKQIEFAPKIGITPKQLWRIESNNSGVSDSVILLICYLFNTNYEWIKNKKGVPFGEKTLETAGESVKDDVLNYIAGDSEEQHQVNKLLEILRDGTDGDRKILTATINVLCGDRLWIKQGSPERRKKQSHDHGQPERRLKIHTYP